jgi:hypothetical protein
VAGADVRMGHVRIASDAHRANAGDHRERADREGPLVAGSPVSDVLIA